MTWMDLQGFDFSDEELMIRDLAREFANSEVLPEAAINDREHRYPEKLVKRMAELGFMGAFVSPEYSGSGMSVLAYCLAIEELATACASTAIIMSAHNSLAVYPIMTFGSLEQKNEFLIPLAKGQKLGCFALSEPGTGSDAAAQTCSVKKTADGYLVNGTKNWITNAPKADVCVLFTMQDASKGNKGISCFVHDLSLPGISRGKLEDKLGICASPTSSITYDNALLPFSSLLNPELDGFKVAMSTLNGGRLGVAAQAIGIAKAALAAALKYSKERKTFGKYIHEHQTIQNYFADMICKIDAARLLLYSAARIKESGANYIRQAAMAKLFASEAAMEISTKAVQIHGGYGYVKDFSVERHMRDAKITEIYEGTSEIQRLLIASQLLRED